MKKIEVPTDNVPKFELLNSAADIQRMSEEREARGRGTETEGGAYTLSKGGSGRKACKDRQK